MEIIEPHSAYGNVRRVFVIVRCIYLGHLTPCRQAIWSDVGPVLSSICRFPDEAVISTCPQEIGVALRRGKRIDHTALCLHARRVHCTNTGRNAGLLACQVGTDRFPGDPSVARFIYLVGRIVERMRILRREGWA